MLVTNRSEWAERARYLTTQAKDDPIEYIHGEVGYNYRLTNLQAAMGCAQMEQMDSYIEKKREIARVYDTAFQGIAGITPMREAPWASSTFWMYTILVDERRAANGFTRTAASVGDEKDSSTAPLAACPPIRRSSVRNWLALPGCGTTCPAGIEFALFCWINGDGPKHGEMCACRISNRGSRQIK